MGVSSRLVVVIPHLNLTAIQLSAISLKADTGVNFSMFRESDLLTHLTREQPAL